MADERAQSPLEALNARGLTAKREYVRGLEQRRDPEALSLLVECLCDESWFLRDLAEQAFFRMGEEHAAPLLPLLVGGLWYTRLSAVRLLGRLGFRPAVPALIDLCDDKNETVSQAAREALLAVARQRGSARIAHALQRTNPERRKQRLAEIAENDRGLAKQLERLMADVDLMAADKPDTLVDPEEAQRAGAPAVAAPKEKVGSRPAAAVKPPATVKPAAGPMPSAPMPAPAARPAPATRPADAPKPAPSTQAAAPASAASSAAGTSQTSAAPSSAAGAKTAAGESRPLESRSPAEHSSLFGGPVSRAQTTSDAPVSAARPSTAPAAPDTAPQLPGAPPTSASGPTPSVAAPRPEASKPPAPPKPAAAKPATPKAPATAKAPAAPKATPKPPAPPRPAADVTKPEPSATATPAAAPLEPPKAPAPAAPEPAPPAGKAGEPPDGG
jgi:HEAT repeat protein